VLQGHLKNQPHMSTPAYVRGCVPATVRSSGRVLCTAYCLTLIISSQHMSRASGRNGVVQAPQVAALAVPRLVTKVSATAVGRRHAPPLQRQCTVLLSL
jgi:hypothetical protein